MLTSGLAQNCLLEMGNALYRHEIFQLFCAKLCQSCIISDIAQKINKSLIICLRIDTNDQNKYN